MPTQNHTNLFKLAKLAQIELLKKKRKPYQGYTKPSTLNFGTNAKASPNQIKGKIAENLAVCYLSNQGLILLQQNLLYKTGEIDIVMQDNNELVFIEVRLRNNTRYGSGLDSINHHKKTKIIRTAQRYLPYLTYRYFNSVTPTCRFDVVSVNGRQIEWVKYAFETNSI